MTEFAIGGAPGGEDVFGGRPLLPELRHHHRPNTPTTDLDQRGPTANYTALSLDEPNYAERRTTASTRTMCVLLRQLGEQTPELPDDLAEFLPRLTPRPATFSGRHRYCQRPV
jgi:hypothetical protein